MSTEQDSAAAGRYCVACRHQGLSAHVEPCRECLAGDGETFHPLFVSKEARPRLFSPLVRQAVAFLQEERDRTEERERLALERATALELRCDRLERKLADERQATDDQIAALERGAREWDVVRRGCGCVDPVWLLAARCLLLSQRREEASERYGWLIGERGDWQLSWNRAHVAATVPGSDPCILVHVDAKDIVARRAESEDAGSYRLGLCMWAGPMWAGECLAGSEAAQDLEAELRTWLEDLESEGVHHG